MQWKRHGLKEKETFVFGFVDFHTNLLNIKTKIFLMNEYKGMIQ